MQDTNPDKATISILLSMWRERDPMLSLAQLVVWFHLQVSLVLYVIPKRTSWERGDSDVVTGMNCGIALSLSQSNSLCNSKLEIMKLGGSWRILPPFKGEHLEWAQTSQPYLSFPRGKPLVSHMVGRRHPVHPNTPNMIGWTIIVACTGNQVLGRSPTWALFLPYAANSTGTELSPLIHATTYVKDLTCFSALP